MSNKCAVFTNLECLPVDILTIPVTNAGVIQQVKALDTFWVEKRDFILYESPPLGNAIILGAASAWKSKMEVYLDNLKWLLSLEHHRFWSTILYHPQCMDSLVSFLQEANPPYIPLHDSREIEQLYEEIRRLVLIIFSRLVTNKESKTQWMTKEFMADVLYNNFIFTIPIIWDICLTYGADNSRHVSRILESVFALQPRYEGDATAAVAFVNETFKYIILQVNKDYDNDEPPNLPETFKGFSEIKRPSNSKNQDKLTLDMLKDLVIHMLDTALTLRIFLEVYPKSVKIFRKTNFVISIVQVYEYGIPLLYERIQELAEASHVGEVGGHVAEVTGHVDAARAELVDCFREVLAIYKNAIFSDAGNISTHVEDFLAVMMDGLSEKLLIRDYHACYPVHEDLEMLRQVYPDIDTVKTDFILQAIYSNLDDTVPETIKQNGVVANGHAVAVDYQDAGPSTDNEIPDNIKQESLISEVKDILPHLGDGFILKCLEHYGFNSERVINSILEDNLAEPLKKLDQTLPIVPEDPLDKHFLNTGIQRLNVFDGDEFDIMTRDDVDLSRIHVGKKKSKYKDLGDMLDDKMDVKQRIDIYSKYNLVCEETAMYSDEYDDTYDAEGVEPPRAATEDDERRPFVAPRVLQTARRTQHEESEEESEVEEEKPSGSERNRLDFCSNPEEIRARREANFQARRGKGHRPPPPSNVDVVGKPRGQGQEKDVVHNREKKEKHKSSRANHNRRQGAQWKRTQGLIPS
ncbi:activating signal cointegrator 1 complex subunit 2 [Achroia grisella]|uniref:activating signal cointegrator 1 complex subunit 2 n=1 Tax=Achroia grisella TaxID=688607 RepID=UPI0027D340BC|nr:activating signal cointegrator 1 complex subunit 2 [Achroia grisella]